MQTITGFILTGGKSSRMGSDKAFLTFDGKPMIDRAIAQARSIAEEVFIVGPKELYGAFGRIVKDEFPDCGPLGGIHAALRRSKTEFSLVLAVDTPLISVEFLRYLAEQAQASRSMVTLPRAGGLHPLCAVYRAEFAEAAERALKTKSYKVGAAFPGDSMRVIDEAELSLHGFDEAMFANLNTPEEFAAAQGRMKASHPR